MTDAVLFEHRYTMKNGIGRRPNEQEEHNGEPHVERDSTLVELFRTQLVRTFEENLAEKNSSQSSVGKVLI